ncbi:hypothetical protein LGL55_15810 [Clostridium tagluense]|uniref:hypothetical protein n=1 Tax=Clostridium tagluense TaxID=360422 RepID=UPI0013E901A5|nr:hypothetical protein [Clostridium tagluense]MCB2312740.1 hypothetical protein [Clostridium tagluense]MCB2317507.1 hypothetical protein [Clostridium tagluense]MCB2322261.1 hypothetical protein [Clostridium tagluense]MCB2327266.1 hypothetical protein [Clostridium tagluense]MCB2332008.1 hypothetical protein [Clostridium tagluense]
MLESRCGVCCSRCVRKGCLNMGKDQGFDPLPKIEQCRKWMNEQDYEDNPK